MLPLRRDQSLMSDDAEMQNYANGAGSAAAPVGPVHVPRVAGSPDDEQLAGEHLVNDPDWPRGHTWAVAYMQMHNLLLTRAAAIHSEGQEQQQATADATRQADPSIKESLRLLRREVFSLCPLHFLYAGMVVSCVLTVTSFTMPTAQGHLVDSAVDAGGKYARHEPVDIGAALVPGLTAVGIQMFVCYCCEIVVGILFAVCGHTTVTRLRIKLFRNLTEQEIGFYDAHVSGELSSRLINDSASLSSLTQFTTQTLLQAVVKFSGALVAMYWTHPKLAVIATFVTPLSAMLVRRTGKTVGKYGIVQNDAMAKANAVAIEVLGSIRTVQSNVGEKQEAHRFMERLNYYLRVIKATVYLETVLRFTQFGLSRARDLIVLAVAMHQVIYGTLTIGSYIAFSQYVQFYEDGFRNLADIWINFKQTITSTGKFVQLLLREPEIRLEGGGKPDSCSGRLALENVCFAYSSRPDLVVLSNISLTANPGDVVALVGESGAGKSTVGRLLLRFYDPCEGRILLDGLDYRSMDLRWLRSQVGFVEQEPVLFDRSISDNIAYGSAIGRPFADIRAAAETANADDFINRLQHGYNTRPGERAARISGGQKQRVAIARAVIRNPKVLLLDEATSALDSENEHIVQQALDKLMVGKTTFIIAHRLSTVVRSSCILVLDKGRVIENGTHEELVARDSKYASFMKHQLVSPLLS
mmetsp:Transcript_98000/g.305195  ORF Transcript_98000/g.305195 Transcript_98000/m.305195 type:complete len:697 (-) Transcript_98000:176-2266(-)